MQYIVITYIGIHTHTHICDYLAYSVLVVAFDLCNLVFMWIYGLHAFMIYLICGFIFKGYIIRNYTNILSLTHCPCRLMSEILYNCHSDVILMLFLCKHTSSIYKPSIPTSENNYLSLLSLLEFIIIKLLLPLISSSASSVLLSG